MRGAAGNALSNRGGPDGTTNNQSTINNQQTLRTNPRLFFSATAAPGPGRKFLKKVDLGLFTSVSSVVLGSRIVLSCFHTDVHTPNPESFGTMLNVTGLAVGLSIGIPTFLGALVFIGFWMRQNRKYREDLEEPGNSNDDPAVDLDLDHLVDSPKENKTRISDVAELDSTLSPANETVLPNVVLKNGDTAIRKKSKIMGLKLVPRDERQSSSPRNLTPSNNSVNKLSKKQSDDNYKTFYESVIPLFTEENGSSVIEKSSVNETVNPPNAIKTNSSHSSMDLTKLLYEDSSRFPDSRITSSLPGESPLRNSRMKSSLSSMHSSSEPKDMTDPFNTPRQKESLSSPLKYSGTGKRLDLSEDKQGSDSDSESLQILNNIHKRRSHAKVHGYSDDDHDDDDDDEIDNGDEISESDILSSDNDYNNTNKSYGKVHRRGVSLDRMGESETDIALQNYQNNRKEWLNSYRPH